MSAVFKVAFHPKPATEAADTSLRYTDILFGFVIRELFIRLAHWTQLDGVTQCHLIVGATLVLGSWIGYRRSLNRSGYQLKFFNLPLFRFLIDQTMLVLYFRMVSLTPVLVDYSLPAQPHLGALTGDTTRLVMYVFIFYLAWDVLGFWIANAKNSDGTRLYPGPPPDTPGLAVTFVAFIVTLIFWLLTKHVDQSVILLLTAAVLTCYRWAKEIRTSCR
jgi:hypothetical protein